MRRPVWVREDVVLAIHIRQLAEHGGTPGIRDAGLLQSALARPLNLWSCAKPKPDLAALGASYTFVIVKNHPFLDGNKRTGYVTLRTFLLLNNCDLEAEQEEKYFVIDLLAGGKLSESELAEWVRARIKRVSKTKRRK